MVDAVGRGAGPLPTCARSCGNEHPAVPLKAVPTVVEVLARAHDVARDRERQRRENRPALAWEELHPVAARLSDAAPSPDLVTELAVREVADVDDAGLVEMTAAWERILSWATAAQSRVVAEMVRRARSPREEGFVADEIAAATGVTPRAGRVLVERAAALMRAPAVHDSLAAGTLTTRKADTLCRVTAHLPPGQAALVQSAVLAHGSALTAPQIRALARRVELELDPAAATARHEAARRTRAVWMEPAEDCMAYVHAYLPAPDALRVMTAVDAVAAAAAREDDRGVDARRADALVDVLGRVLDLGVGPDGMDLPVTKRRRPHINVTLNLSTLLGLRDDPAVLAGYGPIGAQMGREIAAQGAWSFSVLDPRTGEVLERSSKGYRPSPAVVSAVVERTPTCTFPGCGVAASWCDLDHITPYDHGRPREVQTRADGLHPLCRHHHVMKTHGSWTPARDPGTGVTTWHSRTGQVYTRDPVAAPFEPGPPEQPPCDPQGRPRSGTRAPSPRAGRAGPPVRPDRPDPPDPPDPQDRTGPADRTGRRGGAPQEGSRKWYRASPQDGSPDRESRTGRTGRKGRTDDKTPPF